MRYAVMVNERGYQVAGHLSSEEMYELKQQGYRTVISEVINYRVFPFTRRKKHFRTVR